MEKLAISAPAHLHTGNFDLTGDLGRLYGTVGFAIDLPLEVEVSKAKGIKAEDKDAFKFAKRFVEKTHIEGAEIHVKKEIPKFVGLGFHTTLALSIGVGLSKLYELNLSVEDVALIMGRGTITALGVYAFKTGGFIIEGGFKVDQREKMVPPLILPKRYAEKLVFRSSHSRRITSRNNKDARKRRRNPRKPKSHAKRTV